MSIFTSTHPQNGARHLLAVAIVAAVAFIVPFIAFNVLLGNIAVKQAAHHNAELFEETVTKLKADEKKKLPKGAKVDEHVLEEAAKTRLKTDAKVKAAFEKKLAENEHHAQGGLFPLATFVGIVSGLVGALWGSVLLVKRTKDAGVPAWPAFLMHLPSAAFFGFLASLPLLSYLAHHEGVSISKLLIPVLSIKNPVWQDYFTSISALQLGFFLACIGAGVHTIASLLSSGKCHDDDHHGESCCAH